MDKDKMEIRKLVELKEAASYLEDFVAAMKKGEIKIEQAGEELILTPSDLVEIEVEAKTKKGKGKFSLEISWRTACPEGEEMTISPAPKAAPEKDGAEPARQAQCKAAGSGKNEAEPKAAEPKPAAKAPAKPAAKAPAKPEPKGPGAAK